MQNSGTAENKKLAGKVAKWGKSMKRTGEKNTHASDKEYSTSA